MNHDIGGDDDKDIGIGPLNEPRQRRRVPPSKDVPSFGNKRCDNGQIHVQVDRKDTGRSVIPNVSTSETFEHVVHAAMVQLSPK